MEYDNIHSRGSIYDSQLLIQTMFNTAASGHLNR